MVKKCVADGCGSIIGDPGISVFRFPPDESQCLEWMNRVGFDENHKYGNFTQKKCHDYLRLCNKHFEDGCFYSTWKNKLRKGAVPTLFKHQYKIREISNTARCQENQSFCEPSLENREVISSSIVDIGEIPSTSSNVSQDEIFTDAATQTSKALSAASPRKQALRKRIRTETMQM